MKHDSPASISRRHWLQRSSCGFGILGLIGSLTGDLAAKPAAALAPKRPHFRPRARRVIFLFMHGGPSHIDTFDPKPRLIRDHGKPLPFDRPLTFAEGKIGAPAEIPVGVPSPRPKRARGE